MAGVLSVSQWQDQSSANTGKPNQSSLTCTCTLIPPQVPGSGGNAYLLGGSESYGPGVFSQQLIRTEVNASEVYLLTRVSPTNDSWHRVRTATFPENLDSPCAAVGAGAVYYFGGRRLEE